LIQTHASARDSPVLFAWYERKVPRLYVTVFIGLAGLLLIVALAVYETIQERKLATAERDWEPQARP
jgi:hypothetical protein